MRHISGYVIVRETGIGISNLVVTAFDSGGAPEILRKQEPTADVMKQLGRRISTVFTDDDGMFSFSTEDLEFPGNEPRPDLVIVVFAPEDIVDSNHPYPKPPEDRVLYMSLVPRLDAGAQEAFLIRLSSRVLYERRIDTGENRFANTLEEQWKTHDAISDSLMERHKVLLERKAEARKEALERTKNLHGVPVAMRRNSLLVVGKANLSEMVTSSKEKVTRIEALQHKTVTDGLQDLAGSKRTMRLYLTKEDLTRLEMGVEDGTVSGKPTHENVKSLMLSLTGGVDLVRVRGMNNPNPDELEAKYLNPPAAQPQEPRIEAADDTPTDRNDR